MAPPTGVVVLTWHGRANLERLLPTLKASDHPDLRIIVVDNGSRDGTPQWVAAEHPDVTLVRNEANLRFAEGNNRGAIRALEDGAEVVVLLNDDTTVAPETLRRLTEPFDGRQRLGVVGPRICHLDDPGRIWFGGGELSWWTGWVSHRALRRPVGAGADPAGPTAWVTGCALAVRASAWQELGGLDPSFYIYSEDVDFCVRAAAAGWELAYEPGATVLHAISATTGGSDSAFKAYHKTRSRWALCRRYARARHWPTLLPSLLAQDFALGGRDLLAGRRRAVVGRFRAWTGLGSPRNQYPAPVDPSGMA